MCYFQSIPSGNTPSGTVPKIQKMINQKLHPSNSMFKDNDVFHFHFSFSRSKYMQKISI